jgi:uncharacterized sulfatase
MVIKECVLDDFKEQDRFSRRKFLLACAAAGLVPAVSEVCAMSNPGVFKKHRPNILWIIAEDICCDFGCYGNEVVQTPNIDGLAREGAIYQNAFTTAPICSPSRSAFMTGMYQTSIGAHNHRSHRDDGFSLGGGVRVITEYFREAGYFTSNSKGLDFQKSGKKDLNFKIWKDKKGPFDGTDWRERDSDQPFFAKINFYETHRPFVRDEHNPVDADLVEIPPYYPDHRLTRADFAMYLESIQVLDRKIGKVIQRLKDDGLYEDTIIFFFGDNGRPFPRGKQNLYEGGIHVPLIIRWPGKIKAGSVVSDLVSAIDLAPASMQLAGIEEPAYMQGRDFLSVKAKKRKYIFAAKDRCDAAVDRVRCVRTDKYKYIKNFNPDTPYFSLSRYSIREHPEYALMKMLESQGKLNKDQMKFMAEKRPVDELYDIEKDPHELNNLAVNPKYAGVLNDLKKRLDRWIAETDDKGRYPESEAVLKKVQEEKILKHARKMNELGLSPDVLAEEHVKWWEKRLLK